MLRFFLSGAAATALYQNRIGRHHIDGIRVRHNCVDKFSLAQ